MSPLGSRANSRQTWVPELHVTYRCVHNSALRLVTPVITCRTHKQAIGCALQAARQQNEQIDEELSRRADAISMLQFSTDLVPVSDRFDAWQWNAQKICGDCRFHFPRNSSFSGSIRARNVGELRLTQFSSTPLSFEKRPLDTAGNSCFIVITQLQGTQSYRQGNVATVLKPRDTTLISSALPWSSDSPEDCARLYLRVPAWLMQDRLQSTRIPMAQRINGQFGLGVALFRLATSLYDQALVPNSTEEASGLEAFFQILSACLGCTSPEFLGQTRDLAMRIESFIKAHLADPALGPSEIAADVQISVRHLHRLFANKGRTVSDWIRECRLKACREDLRDPRLYNQSITNIAFSWGFSDSAHFSRSFRKSFGVSPREFRSTGRSRQI